MEIVVNHRGLCLVSKLGFPFPIQNSPEVGPYKLRPLANHTKMPSLHPCGEWCGLTEQLLQRGP
jgi:hypothetical protein